MHSIFMLMLNGINEVLYTARLFFPGDTSMRELYKEWYQESDRDFDKVRLKQRIVL